jgi:hypothetical protein
VALKISFASMAIALATTVSTLDVLPIAGKVNPATVSQDPLPWIGAPQTEVPHPSGFRKLFNTSTKEAFVPRGMNYVKLSQTNSGKYFHSTFEPNLYSTRHAESFLQQMQYDGYNVVRVFVDPGSNVDASNGTPHGVGLGMDDWGLIQEPYLDNFADFVRRAAAHRIYVLPSLDLFPQNAHYYKNIVGPIDPVKINASGSNLTFMHMGHIRAKKAYLTTFLSELRKRIGAPLMSTLLAVQLTNEATFFTTLAPFNRYAGTFRGIDGVTYDMSVPEQRQQAADAHAVLFAGQMVDAVHAVVPAMMVTMGVATNLALGRIKPDGLSSYCTTGCDSADKRYRYPARALSLALYSRLSFIDIHIYPRDVVPKSEKPWTLDAALASVEWGQLRGVVLLGEFGAFRSVYDNSATAAAYAMRDFQVAACKKGFSGFLFWTWDTYESPSQQHYFPANYGGGAINGVLAPTARDNPCMP